MSDFDISGKTMVITGATSGIGRGLVDYFVDRGAVVAAVGGHDATVEQLRDEMASSGRSARTYAADLRDVSQIGPLFDRIAEDHGRIDILVNNAGMGKPIPAIDVTVEDWDTMMDLNLRAAFFCAQAAARHMLDRGYGRIINMSSQISVVANQDEVVYCASKGGLNQVTRTLALEWGGAGVIVTGVAPTFTYTAGTADRLDTPSFRDAVLSKIPRGRFATITDIAAAVQYLASDAGEMANGSTLMVDGGWTIV
ncbi:SDR family oxidoreductase [Demequina sp.]|uniref:SDR family NAD(P)-dependent oxidoreductase n=1 Tax=Demequina sp. TaxID=2050685 RepID=UPI0025BC766B|nr:SDR family oxidoreductase [Demequina sp.]